ncbi:Hypothetical predicted protein [Podarcis lilfordi]|uniref:Uncharacterized protein n=1 Tax=Podarcis lilfordi TaxID=74358 RepID=A0AA35K1Z6_9SAUR|nr:Hypothetical predicted protein [Podarcis lilfordi]
MPVAAEKTPSPPAERVNCAKSAAAGLLRGAAPACLRFLASSRGITEPAARGVWQLRSPGIRERGSGSGVVRRGWLAGAEQGALAKGEQQQQQLRRVPDGEREGDFRSPEREHS